MAKTGPGDDDLEVLWYLTAPDGRHPWSPGGTRDADLSYLRQVAGAIDRLGFAGALLATGPHDVFVQAAALAGHTERMRFLLAVHPPLLSPMLAAKMTATLDQFSRGRVLLNIVNGDADTLAGMGSTLPHDERYAYTDEWIPVWRAALAGETVDHAGRHITVRAGRLALPPVQRPSPPLWFGGSSPAALETAARHIDTYLVYGDTPERTDARLAPIRARAAELGRTLRYGIRLYVIVRDTDEEAWDEAARLLRTMDPHVIAAIQERLAASDSHVQRHQRALHGGAIPADPRELEFAPALWSGIGLIRPGSAAAIVGGPETVARRIDDFRAVGVSTFILSAFPLLEEAYRVSESVLPLLSGAPATAPADGALGYDAMIAGGRR